MAEAEFFEANTPPPSLDLVKQNVSEFVREKVYNDRKIVVITSGGTTVPLEKRTVRFLDNFSDGNRGSASAEYFLESGYAIIFLHRRKSLRPFQRHFATSSILDLVEDSQGKISVKESQAPTISYYLKKWKQVGEANMLLPIEFTTLVEYLYYLREVSQAINIAAKDAIIYSAAAVSDFYFPPNKMPEHKIQSSENSELHLSLESVPKMLKPLVSDWAPSALVVSFKLETDSQILIQKAKQSLNQYGHQVVIANLLLNYKHQVIVVTRTGQTPLLLNSNEIEQGKDIEQKIVAYLVEKHLEYCH